MRDSRVPQCVYDTVVSWGQSHIFQYLDKCSDSEVSEFVEQIRSVDFPRVKALLARARESSVEENVFSPPLSSEICSLNLRTADDESTWWQLGMDAISRGEVAVTILAGGQGTRMGLAPDESKGMLCLGGLVSGKYVFQLFIERLLKLAASSGKVVPLVIMTSPINNAKVSQFLKLHNFFHYPESCVYVFSQGTLPALTLKGDLLLEGYAKLAISPDGNGGIYNGLVVSGVFDCLVQRGVKHLHVIAVDNAIARPADPLFVGACISQKVEIGNKVVWKMNWEEKVGVIAKRNGKTSVVEYSDLYNLELGINNALVQEIDPVTGRLLFGAGNICNHYYSMEGLAKMLPKVTANYHLALKKIVSVDLKSGLITKPTINNGLKLESFIFDAFELAESSLIVEAERGAEFTPMKNPIGEDSPETAVDQILHSHKIWLERVGATVDGKVEIAPEISYSGEGLEKFKGMHLVGPLLIDNAFVQRVPTL